MAKTGPVKIKNYGVEFKLRAVQLSNQPGALVKNVPLVAGKMPK